MENKTFIGHISAFVTIVIWGTTFISTKVLLEVFSPVEILFIRFTLGYFALWCVYPRVLKLEDKKQEFYFIAAGICGVTLYYLLENIALTFTLASNVGVIISIAPFFTVIFSGVFLHEKQPGIRFFIGFMIAMAGIFLISFGNAKELHLNPMGDILAVLAAITWAFYSTLTKKISGWGYPVVLTTRRTFFYGLIFMIPVLFLMDAQVGIERFINLTVVFNLLFLGLGASALCFVTWNFSVRILGAVKTSVYIYMVPVITAVTSAIILHEVMTTATVCGIGLTLAGLFLSENRKKMDITE